MTISDASTVEGGSLVFDLTLSNPSSETIVVSLNTGGGTATESPNARIYVARCLRELGQWAAAYDEMHATMSRALKLEYDNVPERIEEIPAPEGAGDILGVVDR